MESFKYEKRISVILLLAFVIIGIPLFILQQKINQSRHTPSPVPFPSPIAPTYYPAQQNFTKALSITSTTPEDTAVNVSIVPSISIVFSRSLNTSEQKAVTLIASPTAVLTPSWSSDGTTVSFSPTQSLSSSQLYSLTLTYGATTRVWSFTTQSDTSLTNQDYQKLQTISDNAYSNQQVAQKKTYPWLDSLPLSSTAFFTYFDFDTKSFITHEYYSQKSPLTATQENTIQKQVLTALKNIGVDTTKYKLVWQSTLVSE